MTHGDGSPDGVPGERALPRSVDVASAADEPRVPRTLDEFMALALAMEQAAAERYAELADTMEAHNNPETAELFRRLAAIEMHHARDVRAQIAERPPADVPPPRWDDVDAATAESAPPEDLHYLMLPYHALTIALANERRAEQFFGQLAELATTDAVRDAAQRLRAEEQEHIGLIEAWLAKVPPPEGNWAEDPDPPRYTD